jgi:hypothetical protein
MNDLYPQVDSENAADESNPGDEQESTGADNPESDKADSETTLVPKSMLKDGVAPGDTCSFKVVSVHGDEVEIEWQADDKEEAGEDATMGRMKARMTPAMAES